MSAPIRLIQWQVSEGRASPPPSLTYDTNLGKAVVMSTAPTVFAWVDLEMTGLDSARCVILELAMILTDATLTPIAEIERVIFQPDSALQSMSPFVRTMHTKNGLLDRVRNSVHDIESVEREVVDLLLAHAPPRTAILAGNSIHADRRFLAAQMPVFEKLLHYRQLDVSSLKVLAQVWAPDQVFSKGNKSHTALADIRGSIDELKFYRRTLFQMPDLT